MVSPSFFCGGGEEGKSYRNGMTPSYTRQLASEGISTICLNLQQCCTLLVTTG